jgi:type IV pilus assembly protein PilQ
MLGKMHVKRQFGSLALLLLLGLPSVAAAVTLRSIEFSSLAGDRVEIRLGFDGPPPAPEAFATEQPARISVTLDGVSNGLAERYHTLGGGNTHDVTVVEAGGRTRIVIGLAELVPYDMAVDGNAMTVLVGAASGAVVDPAGVAHVEPAAAGGRARVESVDFRRGSQGEGRILVRVTDPRAQLNVTSSGGRIRVAIPGVSLPAELQRRLDVQDFATPVQVVDAFMEGDGTVISIQPTGDYDYLAYQTDQDVEVTVRAVRPEDRDPKLEEAFRYKGDKLSLNFQDIEVRSVLQLVAEFTGLNLVAADTVQGSITLRLQNVPWDQALDLILKTKGLDKRQVGNVLMVAPAAEIAAREKLELENSRQIAELAPLRTEFIQVRYANAQALFALFNKSGEGGKSMLSERGSVIVDERTNSIILTDTTDKLEEFRRVLAQLDIPVRQVLIEARIVTATDNITEELGIRWGGAKLERDDEDTLKIGGSLDTLTELQNIATGNTTGNGTGGSAGTVSTPGDLVVDLGVTGAGASSIGFGVTGPLYLLDLELSALATDGQAEVVARPKVITADKQAATILSGVEIPFQEASSSGATSTSFKEAVLSLEVTPQITPDDRIIMALQVNQDSVGQVFNGVPSINTNEITTTVRVDNGQTLVLGGIFQTDTNRSTTKTPFLGDLPYVGRLFRRTVDREQKQELLIFITPRILEDSLSQR